MEKTLKPMSGYLALLLALAFIALAIYSIFNLKESSWFVVVAIVSVLVAIFLI